MSHPAPMQVFDTPPGVAGRIRTYTGILVDPWNLTREEIRIEDIAHALSNLCRFTGHVREFYSVAQHCVLVARAVPRHLKLPALLHDAAEAYLNDMAGPTKCRPEMAFYRNGDHAAQEAINRAFGCPISAEEYAVIKAADVDLYAIEKRSFMRSADGGPYDTSPFNRIYAIAPHIAKQHYLALFRDLTQHLT